ncbi:hypothetical protein [Parasitella parasitica]|uniref:Actin interacting protein 3 C-terminal domain-containing protein n=1 Tax=Parasitella parasitica TaxID=35722 RepID=A0A0B7NTD1_9FUNG|nr:hypothetical protein [Parasitella parasitica]
MMSDIAVESNHKIPSPMMDIEQSVSKLLMTTKKLLETLTAWSSGTAKDTQVYDEYNALEVHFAGATQAFESMSLPIEDLLHLPDNLYGCLKTTLSKEASLATLEQHLPAIRDTIVKLLQGLKKKQSLLRERYDPSNSTTPTLTTAANSKLLSRAAPRLSPLHTTTLSSSLMPLPSPSSSAEPLIMQQRHSLPRSPISPAIREEFDMNDPRTQDAVFALTRQENLARRSSVRRTSYDLSVNIADKPHVPDSIDIYVRKGDQIKKSSIHAEIQLEEIRQLFRQHFSLAKEQAFDIYILDPASNIEYELEKLSDIKPYSILSFKEKSTETQKHIAPDVMNEMKSLFEDTMQQVLSQLEKKRYANIPQAKIKEQQKELESLRRDLASIHQFHNDYKKETEQVIAELREKSSKMTKPDSVVILDEKAHAEMEESREVTQRAATLITSRLEALQDTIDQLKMDVTQRRCRPSKNQLDHCKEESDRLKLEMDDLQARIKKFKPIWKKTWEVELQQIVKEQQFLKEQEALAIDLKDDHKAVLDVLDQLVKISQIQERKKQLGVECRVVPQPDEEFEGMASVMKEVSGIHVDHSRRVKALAQAESKRSKELSQRIDAFERELTDFVGLRKLKKTGGAQAVDKQRQKKDQAIMKQIFVNNNSIAYQNNPLPAGEAIEQANIPISPKEDVTEEGKSSPSKCIES